MEWTEIWKVAAGVIGGAGSIVGFFKSIPKVRSATSRLRPRLTLRYSLKADLEILNLLKPVSEPEDPNIDLVKKQIDKTIIRLYVPQRAEPQRRVWNWRFLVLGIICFPSFTYWTWYLVKDGFSWWAIATGIFALAAVGWLIAAFEEKPIITPVQPSKADSEK